MMWDTGLYLNWIPGTLVPDGDEEEEFEATEEDTLVVGKWNFYFVQFFRISENNVIYTRVCKWCWQCDCGTQYWYWYVIFIIVIFK